MSVLQRKRSLSKMEYVTNAYDVEKGALDFVKRLSVKNARIFQDHVVKLAMLQADTAYVANEIYPTNKAEYQLRRMLHGISMSILHALDKRMADVYDCLMENPQEAFNRKNGKPMDRSEAIKVLDKMAEKLGSQIDYQDSLLKGIRDSDKERSAALPAADPAIFTALVKATESIIKSFVGLLL